MSQWPTISDDPELQAVYEGMRAEGTCHNLAEMLSLGQPPMSNTDREFLHGHCNGNQFDRTPGTRHIGDLIKAQAEEAGVSTTGKVYVGGLAEFPGDPRAWISGRGDAARICEERGWNCDGAVKVNGIRNDIPVETCVPGGVADDILQDRAEEILAAHPEPQKVDVGELKEEIRQQIKPHWAK